MSTSPARAAGWAAVAELHHRFLTGAILTMVSRCGGPVAADVVFGLFRRQHLQKFLPGLAKLGLDARPDAVKAASYHYLANAVGGVLVELVVEHDRKAWVRFVPPRWMYDGVAICGVPSEVSRAVLHGWYGHNGASLGNPRLRFVCTGQTMDGQPGLSGYFEELDREVTADERVVFAPGEEPPLFDPSAVPVLPASTWPADRLAKAARNYAMDYVANLLPEMAARLGPAEAAHLGRITGRLVGMSFGAAVIRMFDGPAGWPGAGSHGIARVLGALAGAMDDDVEVVCRDDGSAEVRMHTWRLMRDVPGPWSPACFEGWNGLVEGIAEVHDRFTRVEVRARLDDGDDHFAWRIRPRPRRV